MVSSPALQPIEIPTWLGECLATPLPTTGPLEEKALIRAAFEFAHQHHREKEQKRASGEEYIVHPIAVATLLHSLGAGPEMLAAGLLHDIVEDTQASLEDLEQQFGPGVRSLVEGVTKLSKFNFSSKTERQAENFRRMFLAMAQDIRVIVVKLADRLHNMRTLEHLGEDKRRRIARETREIFAPLANRLGIGQFKWELEDLAFKYLEPEQYRQIQELVVEKRSDRQLYLDQAVLTFRQRLGEAGVAIADISGRPKHLYSIYQKMQRQHKEFGDIYDLSAIRIILDTDRERDCYTVLAVVHDSFKPIPGRFKDYIALPKPNCYQSLHTVVIGESGYPLEVQIRTLEMHQVAEYGIAAHWKYKESGGSNKPGGDDEKFTWLRQLLEWQSDLKDAQEYLDTVKGGLFDEDVYVFTPKGDVVSLTRGSTGVDFAYRIHTEVGNHCAGVRINGRMVPLNTQLKNGDIVQVITQKNSHPSLDWLDFVSTEAARSRIRQWYKKSCREENINRGREILEGELGKNGFETLRKSPRLLAVAERCNYQSVDDLLAALGYGEVTLGLVVNRLRDAARPESSALEMPRPMRETGEVWRPKSPILGVEGLVYHLAGCCNPLPGEEIIGVVTLGNRGISIHRQSCENLHSIPGDRLLPVTWNDHDTNRGRPLTYPVNVQVSAIDRVGILKDVLARLADSSINVRNVNLTFNEELVSIDLCIEVKDRDQVERAFAQVRKLQDVLSVRRVCREA